MAKNGLRDQVQSCMSPSGDVLFFLIVKKSQKRILQIIGKLAVWLVKNNFNKILFCSVKKVTEAFEKWHEFYLACKEVTDFYFITA